jgi:hypothetical protein
VFTIWICSLLSYRIEQTNDGLVLLLYFDGVIDAREIADGLHQLARDLESRVASAELAPL